MIAVAVACTTTATARTGTVRVAALRSQREALTTCPWRAPGQAQRSAQAYMAMAAAAPALIDRVDPYWLIATSEAAAAKAAEAERKKQEKALLLAQEEASLPSKPKGAGAKKAEKKPAGRGIDSALGSFDKPSARSYIRR